MRAWWPGAAPSLSAAAQPGLPTTTTNRPFAAITGEGSCHGHKEQEQLRLGRKAHGTGDDWIVYPDRSIVDRSRRWWSWSLGRPRRRRLKRRRSRPHTRRLEKAATTDDGRSRTTATDAGSVVNDDLDWPHIGLTRPPRHTPHHTRQEHEAARATAAGADSASWKPPFLTKEQEGRKILLR